MLNSCGSSRNLNHAQNIINEMPDVFIEVLAEKMWFEDQVLKNALVDFFNKWKDREGTFLALLNCINLSITDFKNTYTHVLHYCHAISVDKKFPQSILDFASWEQQYILRLIDLKIMEYKNNDIHIVKSNVTDILSSQRPR